MSDELEDLRVRAVEGNADALGELYARLQRPVFRLALRMLGDPDDAEDAAQDILIKVATHLSSFEGRSRLMTWVHTIAVRHLLACRKSRAEARELEERAFAELLRKGLAFGDRTVAPDDRVLVREVRLACSQGMLLVLSREERLAVVLVDLIGFDGVEAAAIVSVPPATLRKRLSRARSRLGAFLRAHCGVVNPDAPCSCARQVPGKQARGLTRERLRFAPLAPPDISGNPVVPVPEPPDGPVTGETVSRVQKELRETAEIRSFYLRDPIAEAPAALLARLYAALPTLLDASAARDRPSADRS